MSKYEEDFYAWTQEQAALLRSGGLSFLDLEHLAEEIAEVGQSIEHAIERQLERLLLHLLKLRYDPATRPRRGWRVTVRHARHEIAKHVRRNPSLQHYPAQVFADAYAFARRLAPDATGLPLVTFPDPCPWPIEPVLDEDFWPEPEA